MEAEWVSQRATLRCLRQEHPEWTQRQLAQNVGRSLSWVKKWLARLAQAPPDDLTVLFSRSRARKTPNTPFHPRVIERLLEMREQPPESLQRVPGPKALLYYLPRDPELQALGAPFPRSTRTIWKILRKNGYILDAPQSRHKPREPREPLEEVQMDFKDVTSVPVDPEGKQAHVIEVLNFVDAGTSILLSAQAHPEYHAETALEAVITFLRIYGCPRLLTFDRDPRWVGSASGRDFPSALRRFLLCVGIRPNICPPHRPDKNPYVERYHRSYQEECLQIHRPTTLQEVEEVTEGFLTYYNHERPHQGRQCANQPPCVAYPTLPQLPALPERVDPDRWLKSIHGQMFPRRVKSDGCVEVDGASYYLHQSFAGTSVVLRVNASISCFDVYDESGCFKKIAMKGLHKEELPFDTYVSLIKEEARSEQRRLNTRKRGLQQRSFWD